MQNNRLSLHKRMFHLKNKAYKDYLQKKDTMQVQIIRNQKSQRKYVAEPAYFNFKKFSTIDPKKQYKPSKIKDILPKKKEHKVHKQIEQQLDNNMLSINLQKVGKNKTLYQILKKVYLVQYKGQQLSLSPSRALQSLQEINFEQMQPQIKKIEPNNPFQLPSLLYRVSMFQKSHQFLQRCKQKQKIIQHKQMIRQSITNLAKKKKWVGKKRQNKKGMPIDLITTPAFISAESKYKIKYRNYKEDRRYRHVHKKQDQWNQLQGWKHDDFID